MELRVGRFILTFADIAHETFESPGDYHGVMFEVGDFRYQVLDGLMGERILINHRTVYGHCRDMPFHMGTARFLPDVIHVQEA